MTTRTILAATLAVVATTACVAGGAQPAGVGTGANRLAGVTAKPIDVAWGDGRRTIAFTDATFNYFPVLPPNAGADALRDLTVTVAGEVTIRFVEATKFAVTGTLTDGERQAFGHLSQNLTFEYRTCPREPGPDQPRYTWQRTGTNNEFRPACPGNPDGMLMILTPEVAAEAATFVHGLAQRLAGKDIG